MMPKGLFSQIVILVVAVGIVIAYVVPQFETIAETQDTIGIYKEEREKVVAVNSQLSNFVSQIESISVDDQRRLVTYIPETVDPIAVQRDIQNIILSSDTSYITVAYEGEREASRENPAGEGADSASNPVTEPTVIHDFTFEVEGTYTQMKGLLALFEQNNYPLDFTDLEIEQLEGGFMSMSGTLTTYAYGPVTEADDSIDL